MDILHHHNLPLPVQMEELEAMGGSINSAISYFGRGRGSARK